MGEMTILTQAIVKNRYKLIFTDDESIVREGISKCIDWGAAGFEFLGSFENGKQALDYLEENPVHLVISDINMPVMDGQVLSQKIRDLYPDTKVVLLTGYDDFEYAREALNNHVSRFLLKPITADELFDTLCLIHQELDQLFHREAQQEALRRRLAESLPMLKERFLNRLIRGRIASEQLHHQSDALDWHCAAGFLQLAVCSPNDIWDELKFLELTDYAASLIDGNDEVFRNYGDEVLLLLQGSDAEMLDARMRMICQKMYAFSEGIHASRISIGIASACDSVGCLPDGYQEARDALRYCQSVGLSHILSASEFRSRQRLSTESFTRHIGNLIETVKTGRMADTEGELEEIFRLFDSHYMEPEEAERYLGQLQLQLQQSIADIAALSGQKTEGLIGAGSNGDFHNYREYIQSIISEYGSFISEQRHQTAELRIAKARSIIETRFREKNFSLSDICNELYLSTSQFSHIFKEGMGMTFLEYLTNRRIEEAKLLLKSTDLKGYEIAEKVGFSDPRYFSIVFKKHCGVTAMQYRSSTAP